MQAVRTAAPVTIRRLGNTFVGEVEGVDLSRAIGDGTLAPIQRAFLEHQVLVFREQQLEPAQFVSFSRHFGPLEEHILTEYLLPGHPEIFVISNVKENGRHIGAWQGARFWHSDLMYMAEPSLGSLLYGRECPPEGADTLFADMYAAYQALPEAEQRWLAGQTAISDYAYFYETFQPHRPPLTAEQKAKAPPVAHPAVRTHPETGRPALFVNEAMTSHFEGMDKEASRARLRELTAFATQERFVYRHRWHAGDIVFWDNRCVMHHATPFDEERYRRLMWRTTIRGDRPYYGGH